MVRAHGRHDLPWRQTTDPWAVLVSEVMLQQTSVARVLPRWSRFMERWPTAAACARDAARRRAPRVAGAGIPAASAGALAGRRARSPSTAGRATRRACARSRGSACTPRAHCSPSATSARPRPTPPRDVNLGRVAARAALGSEPHEATPAALDACCARPPAGACRCASTPTRCSTSAPSTAARVRSAPGVRWQGRCAWRARGARRPAPRRRARQAPYRGSLRQLRGALLAQALRTPQAAPAELAAAVSAVPGATPERIRSALDGLVADGLIAGESAPRR